MEDNSIPLLTDTVDDGGQDREVNAEIFMGGAIPELARKLDIPVPRIHLARAHHPESDNLAWVESLTSSHSIFLSKQFLQNWPSDEVCWVIAHELAHISRDKHLRRSLFLCLMLGASFFMYLHNFIFGHLGVAPGTPTFFLTNFFVMFFIVMPIVAPLSILMFLTVLRGEEFRADTISARLVGTESGIALFEKREPLENETYPRFFWFLRTHPSARRRRKRLEEMKRSAKILS